MDEPKKTQLPEDVSRDLEPDAAQKIQTVRYEAIASALDGLNLTRSACEELIDGLVVEATSTGLQASVTLDYLDGAPFGDKGVIILSLDDDNAIDPDQLAKIGNALEQKLGAAAFKEPEAVAPFAPSNQPQANGVQHLNDRHELVSGSEGDLFRRRDHKPVLISQSDSHDFHAYREAMRLANDRGVELKVIPDPVDPDSLPANGDIHLSPGYMLAEYQRKKAFCQESGRGLWDSDGTCIIPRQGRLPD